MKRSILKIFIFTICVILLSNSLKGQQYFKTTFPDTLIKKRLRTVLISESAFYISGLSYLQFQWYKDHESVPFHFYNDNDGWLQMDKSSHVYFAYQESKIAYNTFRWSGLTNEKSILYAGLLSVLMQTPIEIFDGLYEGYGFSAGDIIANSAGTALFCLQQAFLQEQIVKMKFSYSPSGYPKYHPYYLGKNEFSSFFHDYNAQTYWLSCNLKGIFPHSKIPEWLNFAFGYSANGMLAEFSNPSYYRGNIIPHMERYRQYVFSIDLDLTKIKTKSKFLKSLFSVVNVLKVPAPALEYNRVNGFAFHPIYF
ncbi:DUF2279 domain-containing protein [Bacteroidota bacterium]